jgi:hypothetical protein
LTLLDSIAQKVEAAVLASDPFIVVSICSGTGATESHSSLLCLCLDKDKRSLQTGVLTMHKSWGRKPRLIFESFNYATGLLALLQNISCRVKKNIQILVQHPSPSATCKSDLSNAGEAIFLAMKEGSSSGVTFVYDCCHSRNTWTKNTLVSTFLQRVTETDRLLLEISEEVMVSAKGDTQVQHPVLGLTERHGWAVMRNSNEHAFTISIKK